MLLNVWVFYIAGAIDRANWYLRAKLSTFLLPAQWVCIQLLCANKSKSKGTFSSIWESLRRLQYADRCSSVVGILNLCFRRVTEPHLLCSAPPIDVKGFLFRTCDFLVRRVFWICFLWFWTGISEMEDMERKSSSSSEQHLTAGDPRDLQFSNSTTTTLMLSALTRPFAHFRKANWTSMVAGEHASSDEDICTFNSKQETS